MPIYNFLEFNILITVKTVKKPMSKIDPKYLQGCTSIKYNGGWMILLRNLFSLIL